MDVAPALASSCQRSIEVVRPKNTSLKSQMNAAVMYRFQRYHHALQTGHFLLAQARRKDGVRAFFDQACIDSACGLHVLCSVLVVFDLAKSVALMDMTRRKYGVAAMVFEAFEHTYFKGVGATEFVNLVNSLQLPMNLKLMEAVHGDCDRWVLDCLMAGELVALVTANAKNTSRDQHWTLAVGVGGLCVGRENRPDTILLLDPSGTEPVYRPHNSRLRVAMSGPGSSGGKAAERLYQPTKGHVRNQRIVWHYETEDFASEPAVLMAAVRFRLSTTDTRSMSTRKVRP